LYSLKEALDLLNVSMEQGHSLYRTIVKKMFNDRPMTGRCCEPLEIVVRDER
jgi:hypothetical protein